MTDNIKNIPDYVPVPNPVYDGSKNSPAVDLSKSDLSGLRNITAYAPVPNPLHVDLPNVPKEEKSKTPQR
jgi:hypothetical protein